MWFTKGRSKIAPHALKGQKPIAQGNALGINSNQQDTL